MAFPPACQCFFTLLLLFIAASPLQIHARESKFFSKVSRAEAANPKTEADAVSPSTSPLPVAEATATTEQGYGLFGKEETYEYPPTTTNPTKSEPREFKYVQPSGVKERSHYEAGEKQGMSDTRFLESGRYYYDINSEKEAVANAGKLTEEDDDGHESYYGHGHENGNRYRESRYETGEKQGMGDTRWLENGRYFHDREAETKNDGRYAHNVEFYNTDKYEGEEEKYENRLHGTGEKQGMSDTRFLEHGRYFYDNQGERNGDGNGVESYYTAKNNELYDKESYEPEKGESYDSNYEQEDQISNGYKAKSGKKYDFKSTPNKFPRYEFDSMEEYEKYEQSRSHQQEYVP